MLCPLLPLHYLLRRRNLKIAQAEEHGFAHHWHLLSGPTLKSALLDPAPAKLQKLLPPNDRFWADPFVWKHGGSFFVFCEEWMFRNPHAHISVIPLDGGGRMASPPLPVIEEPYHLAYPFLFEFDGSLHLMPTNVGTSHIDIYRCAEFPRRWQKVATPVCNARTADATLIEHDGKWWLFTTIQRGLRGHNHDLFLFWSDSPLSQKWTPHPRNPVVTGFDRARPAGRIFSIAGRLYRPSQANIVRYGYGLNVNEILRLDMKGYRERLVKRVTPDYEPGNRAVHHIDWHDGLLVMDSQRLLPEGEIVR